MKLKGLGNRAYNVLFHTHTVAGIVISFALFVIFYGGAFSLFRHEIGPWENHEMRQPNHQEMTIDQALKIVDEEYDLNWSEQTNVALPTEERPVFSVYGAINDTDSTTERMAAYVNPSDGRVQDLKKPQTTVSTTIYHLHYFRQIPVVGLYLSGLVGLFFLFAVITGVLIHWRNLLTKFFAFIKEGKWKLIWTNAHTVLGIIGLPFQVIYAVTGAFFGLLTLILLPTVFLLYEGDSEKVFNKIRPDAAMELSEDSQPMDHITLDQAYHKLKSEYPDHQITNVQIRNFGKEDAVAVWIVDEAGIKSSGRLATYLKDGEVLEAYSILPEVRNYSYSVLDFITKLHFASFGGVLIKVLYFVLSLITCFMIISGVLLWRSARDNSRYTYKQKLFHHRVTKTYLAICLSMFPAFALIFIANKLVPFELPDRVFWVNTIFFLGWLLLAITGLFWNKYSQQNRNYLIIGGFLSLLVPLLNGLATGGWIWNMWNQYHWVAYVDLFWIFAGVTSLMLAFAVLKVKSTTDKPALPPEIALNPSIETQLEGKLV